MCTWAARDKAPAEVGAWPGDAAVDPGLKQAPSVKSWSEGSLQQRVLGNMEETCLKG